MLHAANTKDYFYNQAYIHPKSDYIMFYKNKFKSIQNVSPSHAIGSRPYFQKIEFEQNTIFYESRPTETLAR